MNVVGVGLPSNRTTDPRINPEPLTVSVKLPPAATATTGFGEMLVIEGSGLLTVRVTAEEVPPPGVGLETVMDR
jgi:hypothetical protein